MAHAWKACWVQALGGSNPPSSATLTSTNARLAAMRTSGQHARSLSSRLIRRPTSPDEAADALGNVTPNCARDVLVAGCHRRGRPAHQAHHRPLRNAEDQERSRGSVPGIVQTTIPETSVRE